MRTTPRPQESEAIEGFPRLARKFCMLIVSSDEQELHRFLTKVASLLGELYSVAFLLPDVSPVTFRTTFRNLVPKKKLAHRTKRYKFLNEPLGRKAGSGQSILESL
jgi:hypothetical protein